MKLAWKLVNDLRMASTCDRYVIDRQPSYSKSLAMEYRYVAKLADMQAQPLGEFKNFKRAAEACDAHLQQQSAASTTEGV